MIMWGYYRRSFVFLLAILYLLHAKIALAQTPFTCDGTLYQIKYGQLTKFDPSTSTFIDFGPLLPEQYNPIGYNINDNYLYTVFGSDVVRIDANGATSVVATTSSPIPSYAGDMDANNNLIMRTGAQELTIVNVYTGQTTIRTLTGINMTASTGDLSYLPASITGTVPHMIVADGSQLILVDLVNNVVSKKSITGYPSNQGYTGASWIDSTGRLFVFRNVTGEIYEIIDYLTSTPYAVLNTTSAPTQKNDGANCWAQPFFNQAPIAQNDEFETPFETPKMGNILVDNGSGADIEPDNQTISVSPTSNPTNGTLNINSAGDITYTPNTGFYGTDTFSYKITDPFGAFDTALVTVHVYKYDIDVTKDVQVYAPDALGIYALPGNDVIYTITLTNQANGIVDDGTTFLVDALPTEAEFYFGDIDGAGPELFPVSFTQSADGGLIYDYNTDVGYSDAATAPQSFADCTYSPLPGYDPLVTYLCFNPKGSLAAGTPYPSAKLSFRMRIK